MGIEFQGNLAKTPVFVPDFAISFTDKWLELIIWAIRLAPKCPFVGFDKGESE